MGASRLKDRGGGVGQEEIRGCWVPEGGVTCSTRSMAVGGGKGTWQVLQWAQPHI